MNYFLVPKQPAAPLIICEITPPWERAPLAHALGFSLWENLSCDVCAWRKCCPYSSLVEPHPVAQADH